MRISITPAFWRAMTGFLLGIPVMFLGVTLFVASKIGGPVITFFASILSLPVLGLIDFIGQEFEFYFPQEEYFLPFGLDGLVFPLIVLLFWPIVLALAFYLGGKKQTNKVIAGECALVIFLVGLAWYGLLARGF